MPPPASHPTRQAPRSPASHEDGQRLEKLREFGLSPYCSRAYVSLLALGTADARTVSQSARIPPAKVYGALEQLMDKGLVRLILDTPKRYEPVPFEAFVERERDGHLAAARRLEEAAGLLGALFRVASKPGRTDRGSFAILRGRRNVVDKYRQLAGDARKSMLLVLSDGAVDRLGETRAILEEASARRFEPRVLAPEAKGAAAKLAPLAGLAQLRSKAGFTTSDGAVGIGIFDAKDVLISHFVPDDASLQNGADLAIHITEEAITEFLADTFDAHWDDAAPLRPKRASKQAIRR